MFKIGCFLVGLFLSHYILAVPEVAEGFTLSVFAKVPNARQMALSENGTVFVGSRAEGKIHAVLPSGKVQQIASGLNMPSGLALNKKGDLYVAAVNRIYRLQQAQSAIAKGLITLQLLNDELPSASHHGWKFIAFDPNSGNLVVPVGAPCNVCLVYPQSGDAPFGTILSLDINALNSGELKYDILAQGVRNSVGFDWQPAEKRTQGSKVGPLWFTDNGRDWMGDDMPACEINRITQAGQHFGFPFKHAHISETDADIIKAQPHDFTDQPPMVEIQAHSAPLGMMFYTGNVTALKGALLVAAHGSWKRTTPVGYRLSAYWFDEDKVSKHEVLVNWLVEGKKLGRPVDIALANDGSLLISDDSKDLIWQLRAR
jgi:glucose/arabinose dehydrogenase